MKAALKPPYYNYREAYKEYSNSTSSKRNYLDDTISVNLTDLEYNELVGLISDIKHWENVSDQRKHFQIFSSNVNRLKALAFNNVISPSSNSGLAHGVRVGYNSEDSRNKDLNLITRIWNGGIIQSYDTENPRVCYNVKGDKIIVKESSNYSNSVYKDDETGEDRVFDKGSALKKQDESTKKRILIGIAIVALIAVFIILKKKKIINL